MAFAIKFILDGMQEARMIKNDGFNEVEAIHHHFIVDKEFPRIEIEFL